MNAIRGEYLVTAVLACGDCHTTPQANGLPSFDPKDFLGGGREFDVQLGAVTQKFFAPNLTSDPTTGIGKWTDAQIKNAISHGIDNQGNALFPIMPYIVFGTLNDDDLTSIVKFLRTLPPKVNAIPQDTFSIATPAPVIADSQIPQTTLPSTDPNYATAQAGRYLAVPACMHCHTPSTMDPSSPLDTARAFAGGQLFPLGPITTVSANLTPDTTGLAGWSTSDIMSTVQFDQERGHGRMLCAPMPGGPNRDGDMTPEDLTAIATYLTSIAPMRHGPFGCTDAGVPYGEDGGQ